MRIGIGYSGGDHRRFTGTMDEWAHFRYAVSDVEMTAFMAGYGGSVLNAEVCDGANNDCKSGTDEAWAGLGAACDGPGATDRCTDGPPVGGAAQRRARAGREGA